jgi:hypothetical protein
MNDASVIAHRGHHGKSGVQNHSCGEIFPAHLVLISGPRDGYHYAKLPNGKRGPNRYFVEDVDRDDFCSFFSSHARASDDALALLDGEDVNDLVSEWY